MKEINTSFSSFETIIRNNFLYVDKTGYIYEMVAKGPQMFFLSRPRRFGKSLTVSTLEAVFRGKKELFKGLYIDSTDYDWKEYPVVHLDFSTLSSDSVGNLESDLVRKLINIALSYGVEVRKELTSKAVYRTVFEELSKINKVVVLIDEYDNPLSNNIYNPEMEGMRDVLRGFFEVIKANSDKMRFVFITGVTKYSKVSIFSSMNNLREISMNDQYATMFGYTQDELESYFADYIEKGMKNTGMGREEYLIALKKKYDGYRFSLKGETLYNPVSIGSFFVNGGEYFGNYWIDTGGMKLLVDLARKVHFDIASDLEKPVQTAKIASFDIIEMATENVTPLKYKALLLQSGYLTIKDTRYNGDELYLGFPNDEVEEAYASKILELYGTEEAGDEFRPYDIKAQFEKGNTQGVIDNLFSVYAAIPYREGQKQIEADYQGMFYAMMVVIHAQVYLEILTNKGRIDAVVKTKNHVYVIEFKRDESADEALEQIKDKGYYEKYKAWSNNSERLVHLLGINFSTEKRNIESWKEEILPPAF